MSLPKEIMVQIAAHVGKDRYWLLGPLLKAGKVGRDAVYNDIVLKQACIYSLTIDSDEKSARGRQNSFFCPMFKCRKPNCWIPWSNPDCYRRLWLGKGNTSVGKTSPHQKRCFIGGCHFLNVSWWRRESWDVLGRIGENPSYRFAAWGGVQNGSGTTIRHFSLTP